MGAYSSSVGQFGSRLFFGTRVQRSHEPECSGVNRAGHTGGYMLSRPELGIDWLILGEHLGSGLGGGGGGGGGVVVPPLES